MSDQAVDAPVLPQVPRPLTPRARQRSWAELPVRVWLILTITIALVTVYFMVTRIIEAREDRWLIEHGTAVKARFEVVAADPTPGHGRQRAEPLPCLIGIPAEALPSKGVSGKSGEACKVDGRYTCTTHSTKSILLNVGNTFPRCGDITPHDATWMLTYQTVEIRLEPKAGSFAKVGEELPIRIDPSDLSRWTELTMPQPWSKELRMVYVLAGLFVLMLLLTMWRRRGVLRVWRDDPLTPAVVVETRHTAIAPASRLVRFTFSEGDDRRVHATLMPARAGVPVAGETFWLICSPDNPSRAIVAELYA